MATFSGFEMSSAAVAREDWFRPSCGTARTHVSATDPLRHALIGCPALSSTGADLANPRNGDGVRPRLGPGPQCSTTPGKPASALTRGPARQSRRPCRAVVVSRSPPTPDPIAEVVAGVRVSLEPERKREAATRRVSGHRGLSP